MNKSHLINSINEIRRISCPSNSSAFLGSLSLNSSGDASSALKRKLAEDSDYEGSASKKESRLGSPLMSPWEFRRLRADLIDAQAQIVRLEDRIDQLHKKNKESVIFFDQEKSEMRTRLESSRKSIETLEHKLQKVRTREAETRAEFIELKRSHDTARIDRDQRLAELESDNAQLRKRLGEIEENGDIMELKEEVKDLQNELQRQYLTVQEEHEQAENAQARLLVVLEDCKNMEELKLDLQKAQNRVQELESERDEWEEARTVVTVLQDRVLQFQEVEKELDASKKEVAQLKLAVSNKVFMEEKLHDLEVKYAASADREKEFIALKEKNFDLETELERWAVLVDGFCGGTTQEALLTHLNQLNDKELSHSLDDNALRAELERTKKELEEAQEDLQTIRKAAEELQAVMERMRTEGQLLRRKVTLVTRERDSYRQQLDLFEKDLTVTGMAGQGGKETGSEGDQQERIQALEAMLQGYRDQMKRLEDQLELYKGEDAEARIEAMRSLEQDLARARAECEHLSARRDELEEMLEQRIQKGDHPSPNARVLHLRNNPCTQAEEKQAADVMELRKECDRLKARIRLLEAGERMDLTTRSAADVENGTAARVRELEEQLESAILKNTRLKELFKRTSQDFRDVSYMLLGYRIDLVSNKIYRLTNMYSEDPNDHFKFQLSRSGMMEMLETPFTETWSNLVNEHLHQNNSIPCFLSAVTLGLHNAADSAASEEGDAEEESEEEDSDEPIEVAISD